MTTREKYDLLEVREIVENEGLGYAVKDYMGPEYIQDVELAAWWGVAQIALDAIARKLRL